MPEEKIKLQDCIDITNRFVNGEISLDDLSVFGQKITIREYIPIKQKVAIIMAILTKNMFTDTSLQEIKMEELYIYLFFYGVLGGYGLIDCSEYEKINVDNYDLLYPLFNPFILSYCKEDYNFLKEMLFNTINAYNLDNIINVYSELDADKIAEGVIETKQLINELEKEKDSIRDLKDIMNFNDPTTKKVVEELKKIAKEKIKDN